jgi:two-component system nitrogen regulation sensor histidine kinase NtrY
MPPPKRKRRWLTHDRRVLLMAIGAGLPGGLVALLVLWIGDYSLKTQWTLTLAILAFWLGTAFALRGRVVFPLQTLSNLLAAMREEDFSIRARGAGPTDPLGELIGEVNTLADTLRTQRLGALEATALLRSIMAEIDVAVFAFDPEGRLRLVNRAGERLLDRPAEHLLERTAAALGLEECVAPNPPRVLHAAFPGGAGPWELRHARIRQAGVPHELVVLTDVSRALRDQERQTWQKLIRVISHELNNSLTPIKSIAGSLQTRISREPPPPDWRDDVQQGLNIIAARADALGRFTDAYARLARLPAPRLEPLRMAPLVQRVAGLETRLTVSVTPGPDVTIEADPDQLEQLLINLVRNAVDASLETGGRVTIGWRALGERLELWVDDEGPGLSNTTNLFVPFFTTKPQGSGIGLVLSRQIAEAHGGTVTLEDRRGARGCRASLMLPIAKGRRDAAVRTSRRPSREG